MLGAQIVAQEQAPRFEESVKVPGETVKAGAYDYPVTFSGPFALPGVSLPGGTYLIRVPAAHMIQVLSGDREHAYALVSTIPIRRGDVNSPDVTFTTVRADAPRRVSAWFPPGSEYGHELIYPKRAAAMLGREPDVQFGAK